MKFAKPLRICVAAALLSCIVQPDSANAARYRRSHRNFHHMRTTSSVQAQTVMPGKSLSFADFDRRARAGQHLNVVFFGASLTWGANSSNPLKTSYRALASQRLAAKYPKAHFNFVDAAIGGTSSQVGVFRLNRDVLAYKPDLVFLDFSANDDIDSVDAPKLASYESLVRRILVEAHAPVVQVIFPFRWNVEFGDLTKMARRLAHQKIANYYGVPSGDAIAVAKQRVAAKTITLPELWPFDGSHPGDKGYDLFADVAMDAFQRSVANRTVCRVPPQMLHETTYLQNARVRLSSLGAPGTGALPAGWRVGAANRTSEWFDMLMSRWLDDETIASNRREVIGADGKKTSVPQGAEPFRARFRGTMLLLLGESTTKSSKYRVIIDGKVVEHTPWGSKTPLQEYDAGTLARVATGNAHHVQLVRQDLEAGVDHTVEIVPVFAGDAEQELRLESICVAGDGARVWAMPASVQ